MTNRLSDIEEKLRYAWDRLKIIHVTILEAQKTGADAPSLDQDATEIISVCKECFDYCANDIVDAFILPHSNNTKLLGRFAVKQERIYFPIYPSQFLNPKPFLKELSVTNPALHSHLKKLAELIDLDKAVPGAGREGYGCIKEAWAIVNGKKHERIARIKCSLDQTSIIRIGGSFIQMSPMRDIIDEKVDFSQEINNDASNFVVSGDAEAITTHEYRFVANNKEVDRFCCSMIWVTRSVMENIYGSFFGAPLGGLNNVCSSMQHRRDVAKRALVLFSLIALNQYLHIEKTVRWIQDEDLEAPRSKLVIYNARRDQICEWLKAQELWLACRPQEKSFLTTEPPSEKLFGKISGRIEALWVLLWCLGLVNEIKEPPEPCDRNVIPTVMPIVGMDCEAFINNAYLRPEQEIWSLKNRIYDAYSDLINETKRRQNAGETPIDNPNGWVTLQCGIAISWVIREQDHWNMLYPGAQ